MHVKMVKITSGPGLNCTEYLFDRSESSVRRRNVTQLALSRLFPDPRAELAHLLMRMRANLSSMPLGRHLDQVHPLTMMALPFRPRKEAECVVPAREKGMSGEALVETLVQADRQDIPKNKKTNKTNFLSTCNKLFIGLFCY